MPCIYWYMAVIEVPLSEPSVPSSHKQALPDPLEGKSWSEFQLFADSFQPVHVDFRLEGRVIRHGQKKQGVPV